MLAQRTTHASRLGSVRGRRASKGGVYSSEVGRLWRHLRGCAGLRGAERGLSKRVCGLQVGEAPCQVECTRIFEVLHTKLQPKVRWHDNECRRWTHGLVPTKPRALKSVSVVGSRGQHA
eukprot:4937383-Pyramimonas_sp.AAC.1